MMAPRRSRGTPLFRVLLLSIVGSSIVAATLGWIAGTNQSLYSFTPDQDRFLNGLVSGTVYRIEAEEWKKDPQARPGDFRAKPEQRCAGEYFPSDSLGMAGCLQGLKDKPPDGYALPQR